MTITLNIRPEVQAELARQAIAQGRALEAVAATLLEEAVHLPSPAQPVVSVFEEGVGMFGSPTDAALLDEVTERAYAERYRPSKRNPTLS